MNSDFLPETSSSSSNRDVVAVRCEEEAAFLTRESGALPDDVDDECSVAIPSIVGHFKQSLLAQRRQKQKSGIFPGTLHTVASDHQLSRLPYRTCSTKRSNNNNLNSMMMKQSAGGSHMISASGATNNHTAASGGTRSSLEYSSGFGSHVSSPAPLGMMQNTTEHQGGGGGASELLPTATKSRSGLIMRPVRQPSLSQPPPDQLYYTQIQQQQQQQQQQSGTPRRNSLARQDSNAISAAAKQYANTGRRQSRGSILNEEMANLAAGSPMVQRRMPTSSQHQHSLYQAAMLNDNSKRAMSSAAHTPAGARQSSISAGGDAMQYGGAKFVAKQPLMFTQQQQIQDGGAAFFGSAQQPPSDGEMDGEQQDMSFAAFAKLTYADLVPYNQTSVEPTREFLREAVELMLQYLENETNREQKVLNFKHPIKMLQTFDFTLPQDGFPLSQILRDMKETLANAVRTGHPRFFNQLSSGKEIVSLAGDWLTSTTNSNMFTYEIAPVYVIMEAEVLRHMREIIGWPDGEGDGIFAPGGTISNLYALNVARHKKFPQSKQKGMSILPRLIVFTSEQSHYSIKGAAAVTGIGTSNVVEIHTDERGKMIASELDREVRAALDRGDMPFFVNATAGTTVLGAYDPLHDIADICDKYDLWLHVDGAWGAGCLMSPKLRHLADGIERADSVTWNPHKLMGALLQCSAILLREPGLLFSCNQMCADYLFQQDKHYDVKYDTGDRAIQCGRHVDIFKLWLMWRAFGDNGFAARVEHLWAMRDYLLRQLKARQDFWILLQEPECTNVCFWYIPPSLAEMPRSPKLLEKLGRIIPVIKARMMDRGTMMIGYQPASGKPNFFRTIISNAAVGVDDIDFMIDEIVELGKDM